MLGGRGGQPERNRRFLSPSTWLLLEGVTQPLMVATPHYRVMSAPNLRVPGPVHLLEDRGSRRGGEQGCIRERCAQHQDGLTHPRESGTRSYVWLDQQPLGTSLLGTPSLVLWISPWYQLSKGLVSQSEPWLLSWCPERKTIAPAKQGARIPRLLPQFPHM